LGNQHLIICPHCNTPTTVSFPPEIDVPVQYGNRIKSLALYLNNYHFVPLERTGEFFEDVFDHRISEASILRANALAEKRVKPANEAVKQQLMGNYSAI
jgi:transposase